MIKIKLSIPDPLWPILRQTPGGKGIWGNCQFFVNDECDEYDYWIVYENLKTKETARCPKENTILITAEPPSVRIYDIKFLKQFGRIITFRDDIKHPDIIHSQPCLPWMVGGKYIKETHSWENVFTKDYDELSRITTYNKTKLLSIILSKKTFSEGHRKRDNFIKLLKEEFGNDLNIYGIGYNEIKDKWDGIAPYKYYLAFENSSHNDYWTEKLSDCFLAGAYPIYYGCPNINDYFNGYSLSIININKPKEAISTIQEIISNNSYENFTKYIQESKLLILNKYNLFAVINNQIGNTKVTNKKNKNSLYPPQTTLFKKLKNYVKKSV